MNRVFSDSIRREPPPWQDLVPRLCPGGPNPHMRWTGHMDDIISREITEQQGSDSSLSRGFKQEARFSGIL